MNLGPLDDSTFATARTWLDGLARRQEAVSNNISNIDTPGYVAQSVPFEQELQQAIGSGGQRMRTSDARHLPLGATSGSSMGMERAQQLVSGRLDGNAVSIDQEMITLSETQMRFQAAASALNTRIATLREVLR